MTTRYRLHGDCPIRWDDPEQPDPGPCQCQLDKGHSGSHTCCCGNTTVTDLEVEVHG